VGIHFIIAQIIKSKTMNYPATEKINFRKIRDFSGHINASTAFVRQNIWTMLKMVLKASGIYFALALITLILGFYYGIFDFMSFISTSSGIEDINFGFLGTLMFTSMVLFAIAYIFYTSVVYRYILQYIDRSDYNNIQYADIKRYMPKDNGLVFSTYMGFFLTGLVSSFLMMLPIMTGSSEMMGAWALLMNIGVFGSIYLMIPLSFIYLFRIHKGQNFIDSIKGCMALAKGHWWKTLGLYFVATLILYSVSSIPGMFSNLGLYIGGLLGSNEIGYFLFGLFYLGTFLLYFISGTAFSVVIAVRYFSLLEMKEGVNMMERIQDIGLGSDE